MPKSTKDLEMQLAAGLDTMDCDDQTEQKVKRVLEKGFSTCSENGLLKRVFKFKQAHKHKCKATVSNYRVFTILGGSCGNLWALATRTKTCFRKECSMCCRMPRFGRLRLPKISQVPGILEKAKPSKSPPAICGPLASDSESDSTSRKPVKSLKWPGGLQVKKKHHEA